MLEGVALLLVLCEAVHQGVSRLVGDVRQESVHYWHVALQLILDSVSATLEYFPSSINSPNLHWIAAVLKAE